MSEDLIEAARLINEEITWADTHQDERGFSRRTGCCSEYR